MVPFLQATETSLDTWPPVEGNPHLARKEASPVKTTPAGTKIDRTRIAYDFYSEFENVDHPVGDPLTDPLIPANGTIGNPSHTSPVDYYAASFSNKLAETLIIDGPVRLIVDGDWVTKGEVRVTANGSAELYIRGNLDIGGNGMINLTNVPANFVVFGTHSTNLGQTIKFHGNGAIQAAIYAPNAQLQMRGWREPMVSLWALL